MLPNAKLILELGSCLLLLGAQKFGNRDIVNAYLLNYLLTYLKRGKTKSENHKKILATTKRFFTLEKEIFSSKT